MQVLDEREVRLQANLEQASHYVANQKDSNIAPWVMKEYYEAVDALNDYRWMKKIERRVTFIIYALIVLSVVVGFLLLHAIL